jgi:c-di-GMP-binding flagellar brake protein YcgR
MDLRRHHRFPVQFQSMFSGPKLNESFGTMVNLSEGGCGIRTDSPVYPGMQLTLRLHVPNEDAPIKIEQAAVHWNRVGEIGLWFITVSPAERQRLGHLIERMNREQKI